MDCDVRSQSTKWIDWSYRRARVRLKNVVLHSIRRGDSSGKDEKQGWSTILSPSVCSFEIRARTPDSQRELLGKRRKGETTKQDIETTNEGEQVHKRSPRETSNQVGDATNSVKETTKEDDEARAKKSEVNFS